MRHDELLKEIERREYYNNLAPFPVYDTEIINDLKILNMITSKDNSNNEPITYCKTCLSIKIKTVEFEDTEQEVDYCISCSNTDLDTAHISEWEDMYEERYGERFLTRKKED
tara:strand:- start:17277 stop:17612 length:336 start_codon:yes stop_codon:yes gene_type:complete